MVSVLEVAGAAADHGCRRSWRPLRGAGMGMKGAHRPSLESIQYCSFPLNPSTGTHDTQHLRSWHKSSQPLQRQPSRLQAASVPIASCGAPAHRGGSRRPLSPCRLRAITALNSVTRAGGLSKVVSWLGIDGICGGPKVTWWPVSGWPSTSAGRAASGKQLLLPGCLAVHCFGKSQKLVCSRPQ